MFGFDKIKLGQQQVLDQDSKSKGEPDPGNSCRV